MGSWRIGENDYQSKKEVNFFRGKVESEGEKASWEVEVILRESRESRNPRKWSFGHVM